jgi:protein-tyrosine phosphatase
MRILMVCLGNICRSPLAEGILQEKANKQGLNILVESAGTNGLHNGEKPHPLSIKIAQQHGIDITHQRSRKIQSKDFSEFDLIYCMANDVLDTVTYLAKKYNSKASIKLITNELEQYQNQDIPDPYYGGFDGYENVYAMLNELSIAICNNLQQIKKASN